MTDGAEPTPALAPAPDRGASTRDHLANERTLLAWQRTALALLGLGFLVNRFAFEGGGSSLAATVLGLGLILLGAASSVAGLVRYLRTERDIDRSDYRPAHLAHLLLTGAIVVGTVALVALLALDPAN